MKLLKKIWRHISVPQHTFKTTLLLSILSMQKKSTKIQYSAPWMYAPQVESHQATKTAIIINWKSSSYYNCACICAIFIVRCTKKWRKMLYKAPWNSSFFCLNENELWVVFFLLFRNSLSMKKKNYFVFHNKSETKEDSRENHHQHAHLLSQNTKKVLSILANEWICT